MNNRYFLIFFLLGSTQLWGQQPSVQDFEDLEAVGKQGFFKTYFSDLFKDFTQAGKPFDYAGGIGVNMRSYSALDSSPRQDPFFYTLNGNFNARIYKLNLPFSLTIAAKNTEHAYPDPKQLIGAFKNNLEAQRQRFIRFGVSPRYKWIRLHFGHRSMNFSQYTMRDQVFLGAGAELTPGNFRFSAMYGRLAKAEPINLSLVTPNIPKFERKGWGLKMGYGTQDNFIEAALFQAHDLSNSITVPDTIATRISPQANQAIGLVGQKRFAKRFTLKVDLGASALSPNMLDAPGENQFPHPKLLFQGRQTTEYKTAFESLLDFKTKSYNLGLKYRRIDPGYKTLGAYFFNSDLEELTANLGFTLFKGSLAFNGNGGFQRNNLDGSKPNRLTKRVVGTFNADYNKKAFNLNANYSNNASDVAYLLNPNDPTLNVIIVTQDAGFAATYTLQDTMFQHVFTLNGNAQLVTDDVADPSTSAFSKMLVGNVVYALGIGKTGWGFNARLNFNQNALSAQKLRRYGPGVGIRKSMMKGKLNAGIDLNYFHTVIETIGNNNNFTGGLNLNWNITQLQTLQLNWNYLSTRNITAVSNKHFGEVVGSVGYQYRFMRKPAKAPAAQTNPPGKSGTQN